MSKSIIETIKLRAAQGGRKYTWEDLQEIRRRDEEETDKRLTAENREREIKTAFGRSGIMPIHQSCSVTNFEAVTDEQQAAKRFATNYIASFDNGNGKGFIFTGKTGTGKNHLASAICNVLLSHGRTCLVTTVSEMMQRLRSCYGPEKTMTEEQFFKSMLAVDLLVIDEVGLQKNTENEKLALNQIIDQRVGHLKPVGILTNLKPVSGNGEQSLETVLGPRILDRLRGSCRMIPFNWESYRGGKR